MSIASTFDDGYAICGYTEEVKDHDGFIIRTDSSGNELWRKFYGTSNYHEYPYSISNSPNGGFVFAGHRTIGAFQDVIWVEKVDAQGNSVWTSYYSGLGNGTNAFSIIPISSGGYAVAGNLDTAGVPFVWNKQIAFRYDEQGDTLWTNVHSDPVYLLNANWELVEHPNGNIYSCGASKEFVFPSRDVGLLAAFSSSGSLLWTEHFNYQDNMVGVTEGYLTSIIISTNEQLVCVGTTDPGPIPSPLVSRDVWLIKTDSLGNFNHLPVGIGDMNTLEIGLFPNPSAGVLNLRYFVQSGMAELAILDISGRIVHSESIASTSGYNQIELSPYLANGIYQCRLIFEDIIGVSRFSLNR